MFKLKIDTFFSETAMGCSSKIFEEKEGYEYKKAADLMGEVFAYRSVI